MRPFEQLAYAALFPCKLRVSGSGSRLTAAQWKTRRPATTDIANCGYRKRLAVHADTAPSELTLAWHGSQTVGTGLNGNIAMVGGL